MLVAASDPDTVTVVDVRISVAVADALAKKLMSLWHYHIVSFLCSQSREKRNCLVAMLNNILILYRS